MNVELTVEELVLGSTVGCRRRIRAIQKARKHKYGYDGSENWTVDIDGALAENAVAKALGLYWTNLGDPDVTDVGPFGVRATARQNGCLIIHPEDLDDTPFILATGKEANWTLRGWMLGGEGKQDRYWRTDIRKPAFLVPQPDLYPMDNLEWPEGDLRVAA